ncbi:MAG: hypothetical protein AB1445_15805 [Bacillota bacterium]
MEAAFRRLKDPYFVSWSPMFHWTDQKIRVHAFYCVLALALTSLLQREVHQLGLDLSNEIGVLALRLVAGRQVT